MFTFSSPKGYPWRCILHNIPYILLNVLKMTSTKTHTFLTPREHISIKGFIFISRNFHYCIPADFFKFFCIVLSFNPLKPNDTYRTRTAPLTSKVLYYIFIQQIHIQNILNMVYTLRFFLFKMQFVSNS